jgi:ATP-dependent exoDNAse (exonuclease V) beta subunit
MTPTRGVEASFFLEASAGTGKTTQLVEQIVRCVAAGTKLASVVAVTFTHAAAGEMKLRLREELGKAGQSSTDLELAFVGTIHAFCARLLRERPVEAGVDPRFVELDQEAAARLFAGVFRRWVERRLSEPNPVLRRALTRLTWRDDGEGRNALLSLRNAAWSLIEWRDHPTPWARAEFDRKAALDSIIAGALEIRGMRPENRTKDPLIRDLGPVAEFAARTARAQASGVRDDDLLEANAISLLFSTRYLKKGSGFLSKEVKRDDLFNRWGRFALEIKRFQAAAEADLAATLRDELWELVELYQEAKRAAGQLDFNDLLFGARALLQNDDARRYFQTQFRRIFVDEFQDTDPVQAEVLLLLAAGDPAERDWRKGVPAPGKLFLVGDPKQSIYRFRRADVDRYLEVKALLAAAGVKQEPLQQCRRSVQPILDFVNAAFEPLMRENYLPLVGGRPAIEGQPAVIALPMPAPYGKRNFSVKAIQKCAPDAVAGFVAWLIRQSDVAGWRVVDPEAREPAKIAPEHICILFRNFTDNKKDATRDYVRALEAHGIPHMLVGSKSFHGREETVALRAALRAVEWPEDSLSVYAALRGPLFAISDELLLRFREASQALPNPSRKLPDDLDPVFEPVVSGLKFLAGLHRERNARPVAVTLTLLLEHVRAHAGFALRKGGERVLANVYRLIDLARRFEVNGATSFRAFVQFLEEESAGGETSETPLLERKSSGVTLMTAHKSKGLEFPVVILADMNAPLIRFEGGDRHVKSERGLAAQRLIGWSPQELTDNADLEMRRDTEEAWRIAYVAATRARDLLVVAATGDEIRQESWLMPLYPALYPAKGRWSNPAAAPGCDFKGKDTVLRRPVDAEPQEILRPGLHEASIGTHRVVWFDPSLLVGTPETDGGIDDEALLRPTMSEPAEGVRQYDAWRAARNQRLTDGARPEFRVRRITEVDVFPQGIADAEVEILRLESGPAPAGRPPRGRNYGDLVHGLLAQALFPPERAEIEALATVHEIGARMEASDRQQAVDIVLRTFAHPVVSSALKAQRVHREYPVTYEANGDVCEGVIDLVSFDGNRWTVLDYKTGPGDEPRYRRQIAIYGEIIRKTTAVPVRLVVLEIA